MRRTTYCHYFTAFWLFLSITCVAQANLIINGSFEANDVRNNSWAWFTSSQVDGWDGANIEIWDNMQRFSAFDGTQYAELNAHSWRGTYWIEQSFATTAQQQYDVSFAYAARRSLSESFRLDIFNSDGVTLYSQIVDDHLVKHWTSFHTSFTANSDSSTVRFTSLNSGTHGNFLDNVTVTSAITEASAPKFFIAAVIASLCIMMWVRARNKG